MCHSIARINVSSLAVVTSLRLPSLAFLVSVSLADFASTFMTATAVLHDRSGLGDDESATASLLIIQCPESCPERKQRQSVQLRYAFIRRSAALVRSQALERETRRVGQDKSSVPSTALNIKINKM